MTTDNQSNEKVLYCTKCGHKNPENSFKCAGCGALLRSESRPTPAAADDNFLSFFIPGKNPQALKSYYFGVFSLIPVVGIPLGIIALVLGIKGLKYARVHPEAKGVIHAWTGIILGGGFALGHILLLIPLMRIMIG